MEDTTNAGIVAQWIVDHLAEDLERREHVTHPEESCDGSAVFFYYPDEENDDGPEYVITVRRSA